MGQEHLIAFDDQQYELILAFQQQEGFDTVQDAIMTAVCYCLKDPPKKGR